MMEPEYTGLFFAENPGALSGWAHHQCPCRREGKEGIHAMRDPGEQRGLWEAQWILHERLEQLVEEQRALLKLLRKEFRSHKEHRGELSTRARILVTEQ